MEIVRTAQEMGILVYVADYNEDTHCKRIADKAFNISTTNTDAVVRLCIEEQIDGIITGFIDSMLIYCMKACRSLDMPFWANEKQIDICTNKNVFKNTCREFNIPVAKDYFLVADEKGNLISDITNIDFPIIIKPADNSGSRGVFVCENCGDLQSHYKESHKLSKSGVVVAEEYITGQHVNMYYTLCNGEIYLSAMADRYVDYLDGTSAPLPVLLFHNSVYVDEYLKQVDPLLKNMFKTLGMKDGVAFVQGFRRDDGSFVIYEMGYRLNGGGTYELIEACSGYNQLKMLINYSLTGEMGDDTLLRCQDLHGKQKAVNFVLSTEQSEIAAIEGLKEVENIKNVKKVIQVRFAGDKITGKGGSSQVIAYILFTVTTPEELNQTLEKIYSSVKIFGLDSNELRIQKFFGDVNWGTEVEK